MFDDEYAPHEYDDLMDASREALARDIIDKINKEKDRGTKYVGDRVLVWDSSRLTDKETNTVNRDELDHQILSRYPSIVIEENCKYNGDVTIDNRVYPMNLDLVIWNKTLNKVFRTSSDFVKRTEKKE